MTESGNDVRTITLTDREWIDAGEVFFVWKDSGDGLYTVDGASVSWQRWNDGTLLALLDGALDADDPSIDDEKPALRRILRKVEKAARG